MEVVMETLLERYYLYSNGKRVRVEHLIDKDGNDIHRAIKGMQR